MSFESYSHPDRYPRHDGAEARVYPCPTGSAFAHSASFTVTAPLA
jgi:hypothetical protein